MELRGGCEVREVRVRQLSRVLDAVAVDVVEEVDLESVVRGRRALVGRRDLGGVDRRHLDCVDGDRCGWVDLRLDLRSGTLVGGRRRLDEHVGLTGLEVVLAGDWVNDVAVIKCVEAIGIGRRLAVLHRPGRVVEGDCCPLHPLLRWTEQAVVVGVDKRGPLNEDVGSQQLPPLERFERRLITAIGHERLNSIAGELT